MTTLNLTANRHTSRVLSDWAASRPGAAERMAVQNVTVVSSSLAGMSELFAPIASPSGFAVTDRSAVQVSTVYACLTRLSGAILQLPIEQYRMDPSGDRKQAQRGPLWWLLNETPSAAWTAASWKEWIVRCVALRGDQFTEILRSRSGSNFGEVAGLKVHHPDLVVPRRLQGRLVYDCQDLETGKGYTVDQDDMLHFAGFGFDGLRSLSMIQYAARNAIGNSLAAADYMGRSIGEGAMPQIALKYKNRMTPEQTKQLRESFVATYGAGTGARRLPLVLTEGGEATPLSISPIDMEIMGMRQFEREDICHAMGVPPVLIGDNNKTSSWGTGIEQITLGFVKYTVKPHLRRWEEEMNRKLYRNAGPFLEFDLAALLKGDSKAQAEDDRAALGGPGTGDGYKTVNEIRRSRNLPPITGGDDLFKATAKPAAPDTSKADAAAQAAQRASQESMAVLSAIAAAVQANADREPAASVVNIHQAPVTVNPQTTVNNQAPEVNVEAVMPQAEPFVVPAPVVNVTAEAAPAPVVNITNEITAQAAPAQVEVVAAGPSSSVAEHERDAETGEIVRTVTTFKS